MPNFSQKILFRLKCYEFRSIFVDFLYHFVQLFRFISFFFLSFKSKFLHFSYFFVNFLSLLVFSFRFLHFFLPFSSIKNQINLEKRIFRQKIIHFPYQKFVQVATNTSRLRLRFVGFIESAHLTRYYPVLIIIITKCVAKLTKFSIESVIVMKSKKFTKIRRKVNAFL